MQRHVRRSKRFPRELTGPVFLVVPLVLMASAMADESSRRADPEPLVFGMSTALTGPVAHLGTAMRDGVTAAFEEANRAGGIHGRPLSLVALDDGYEPARTVPNMRRLVADEEVLAIVGNVGTPTAVAALPIALEEGILFYGAYTGAGVLRREPPNRYVINFRASYAQETAAIVDALVEAGLALEDVAFFTQRDSYGDSGFSGGMTALKRHGLARAPLFTRGMIGTRRTLRRGSPTFCSGASCRKPSFSWAPTRLAPSSSGCLAPEGSMPSSSTSPSSARPPWPTRWGPMATG